MKYYFFVSVGCKFHVLVVNIKSATFISQSSFAYALSAFHCKQIEQVRNDDRPFGAERRHERAQLLFNTRRSRVRESAGKMLLACSGLGRNRKNDDDAALGII